MIRDIMLVLSLISEMISSRDSGIMRQIFANYAH